MSMLAAPFQLLEINLISAQDLAPVAKSIKAYAVAWLHPDRKLTTQIDPDGHNNPTWNEKFVFRVEDDFLHAEDSAIMIEIYASAWLKDILIGTVGVFLTNLLPPSSRFNNRKSKVQFVALQVRRPSGRPQGILNIGVNLVDATMRSMPMYSEISASSVEYWDIKDPKKEKPHQTPHHPNIENYNHDSKLITLQRSQSVKNDSTINDYAYKPNGCYYGAEENGGSELGVPIVKNGKIVNANGSLCSDVGPSPSVVAAAIAKGLYPVPMLPPPPRKAGNSVFEDWPPEKMSENKIERWRSVEMRPPLPPVYDHLGQSGRKGKVSFKGNKGKNQRKGDGLFSCFGTAMGCEFSITCGGGNRKKRYEGGKARIINASELTYDESSYV